jgi:PAT family beta-lactamase induction signal transducer AmpG
MGYSAAHRGIALSTIGLLGIGGGALIGGWITTLAGLGHSLWLFGALQIFSNAGYFLLAIAQGPSVPLMYAATGFEHLTSGLGTGAYGVLLLRLTEKRFSATQYALLSSLFALPRLAAGPITGFAVHAIGWPSFYLATMAMGLPGLLMLARFVPPGVREPAFDEAGAGGTATAPPPVTIRRALVGGALSALLAAGALVALAALQAYADSSAGGAAAAWRSLLRPSSAGDWIQLVGVAAVGVIGGLAVAAAGVARSARR